MRRWTHASELQSRMVIDYASTLDCFHRNSEGNCLTIFATCGTAPHHSWPSNPHWYAFKLTAISTSGLYWGSKHGGVFWRRVPVSIFLPQMKSFITHLSSFRQNNSAWRCASTKKGLITQLAKLVKGKFFVWFHKTGVNYGSLCWLESFCSVELTVLPLLLMD